MPTSLQKFLLVVRQKKRSDHQSALYGYRHNLNLTSEANALMQLPPPRQVTLMKRHLNSLLQRKHSDFSDARSAGPRHSVPIGDSAKAGPVGVKDGYDWLAQIKRESGKRGR